MQNNMTVVHDQPDILPIGQACGTGRKRNRSTGQSFSCMNVARTVVLEREYILTSRELSATGETFSLCRCHAVTRYLQKVASLSCRSLLANRQPRLQDAEGKYTGENFNKTIVLPVSLLMLRSSSVRSVRAPSASGMGPAQRQQEKNG